MIECISKVSLPCGRLLTLLRFPSSRKKTLLPNSVREEQVEFVPASCPGEHIQTGDRFFEFQEIWLQQVTFPGCFVMIDFEQAEMQRVLFILKNFETQNPIFLDRFAGVFEDGCFICRDEFGFYMVMKLKNKHISLRSILPSLPGRGS